VRPTHDRMPVILDRLYYAGWLDPALTDVEVLRPWLRPFSADAMEAISVSLLVNNARHDGPDCAAPLHA
jgi:putative SOS response-associated peptidase YedK